MGWRFSRSINLGPLRINLSKRGVGASVGAGPFRIGRSASGRNYGSARIPGTGISYRTESRETGRSIGIGCLTAVGVLALVAVGAAAYFLLRTSA
jgi:hypothetical protein